MKTRNKFYFEEDAGGGGGGAATADPVVDVLGDAPAEGAPEPKPDAAPTFDPNAFAKTLGESVTAAIRQSQPKAEPQEKPLTPEEAKKLLNVWDPTDEWTTKFGNLETQKAAVAELRDALIRQADTIAQVRLAQLEKQLEAKYSPIIQHMQQQETQARQSRFSSSYGQLAAPELSPLLGAIVQQLTSEGKTFSSEGDLFKEVATRAEAVIRTTNPDFKLSVASAPKTKSSSIPVTTPGAAGGGGGGGGKGTQQKSTVLSVLGDLD